MRGRRTAAATTFLPSDVRMRAVDVVEADVAEASPWSRPGASPTCGERMRRVRPVPVHDAMSNHDLLRACPTVPPTSHADEATSQSTKATCVCAVRRVGEAFDVDPRARSVPRRDRARAKRRSTGWDRKKPSSARGFGTQERRTAMGRWSKDKRDIYYRKAKEEGWRARSAYKLMQIDDEFHVLQDVKHVVDLCAAPGSWSQVLSKRIYLPALEQGREPPKLVAIDMQPMNPIEGIVQMRGDVTREETALDVIRHFEGTRADLVLSDGAPDVTGLHDFDEYIQSELVRAALWIATRVLRNGGTLVAKIFRGKDIAVLYAQLKLFFDKVTCAKPRCCRNSSVEAFVVCQGYLPPQGFENDKFKEVLAACENRLHMDGGDDRFDNPWEAVVPFVLCKDEKGWDPDQSYELPDDGTYVQLHPVQPPIAPAYKTAIEREGRQVCGGVRGNTEQGSG